MWYVSDPRALDDAPGRTRTTTPYTQDKALNLNQDV